MNTRRSFLKSSLAAAAATTLLRGNAFAEFLPLLADRDDRLSAKARGPFRDIGMAAPHRARPHFRASSRGPATCSGMAWSKNVSRSRMIACGISCSLSVLTPECLRMAVPMARTSTMPPPSS